MKMTSPKAVVLVAAWLTLTSALRAGESPKLAIARGPFEPTMDSLTNYHCPDWFREYVLSIRPRSANTWKAINLAEVKLKKAE